MAEDVIPFPNADKVGEFIESEEDPVVLSLMRLIYGNFLRSSFKGERPEGAVDMLYCFKILSISFHQKEALANAVRGNFGDPNAGSHWE
jgi:hypothetical protein